MLLGNKSFEKVGEFKALVNTKIYYSFINEGTEVVVLMCSRWYNWWFSLLCDMIAVSLGRRKFSLSDVHIRTRRRGHGISSKCPNPISQSRIVTSQKNRITKSTSSFKFGECLVVSFFLSLRKNVISYLIMRLESLRYKQHLSVLIG